MLLENFLTEKNDLLIIKYINAPRSGTANNGIIPTRPNDCTAPIKMRSSPMKVVVRGIPISAKSPIKNIYADNLAFFAIPLRIFMFLVPKMASIEPAIININAITKPLLNIAKALPYNPKLFVP